MRNKTRIKDLIFLQVIFFIYSFVGVFSKIASLESFMSVEFWFYYGISLVVLLLHTFLWQLTLKRFSLIIAFSCKSLVILWGIIWGRILFNEIVTINKIIGGAIVILGILFLVRENE